MDNQVDAESGFQLMFRFNTRPSLLHLDDILFPGGPQPGDIIQISGESAVGKSMLFLKFLSKCLLPKSYEDIVIGGLEAGVILIDTDHNMSLLKLVSLMEKSVLSARSNQYDSENKTLIDDATVEFIIKNALKNLIILKTYNSSQLDMNFHSIEKILNADLKISLILIDSLTSYYWSDLMNLKNIKKMDLYLKVMIEKFIRYKEEYKVVIIFSTQEYFQCKQTELSLLLVKKKIELKRNEDVESFTACIDSQTNYQYTLSANGFTWVINDACGYFSKFEELSNAIKASSPEVQITSKSGSPGSFEVTINGELVHSKLRTLAFPDFDSIVEVIKEVESGLPPTKIKQQSIFNCLVS